MNSPRALVDFVDNPEDAGNSIKELVEFAKRKVPKRERKDTKVRLMATGELGQVGPAVRDGILESCTQVLRSSGFLFMDNCVSVLAGQEEGIYAWVTANYARGTLGGDPCDTTGIIELGGASAQVTLVPKEPSPIVLDRSNWLDFIQFIQSKHPKLWSEYDVYEGVDGDKCVCTKDFRPLLVQFLLAVILRTKQRLNAATTSIQDIRMNPCILKGYNQVSNQAISLNASEGKLQEFSVGGNFSACRAEALVSLQERGGLDL